ncbi:MAG TPA: SDR family oxidoreductase [Marmoricola sp.]|nr:SDR family oxidoreductase [Marmoricola sp.]
MSGVRHVGVQVVIGGASGIGRAIAEALVATGDQVVIADRDEDLAAQVAAELNATPAQVEVTDEDSVSALFAGVLDTFGTLDGVVNSAGVSTLANIIDHDVAEYRRVVDVCLTGSMIVLKHGGRAVRDGGSLVTIASLNARQPGTGLAAYCSAKAGLVMLSQVAALELGARGVRVNTISPGLVVTALTQPAMDIPGIREDYIENTPLGRSGEPREVAAIARFLLSDESAWITGENIDINGGAHLKRYPDLVGLVTKAFS